MAIDQNGMTPEAQEFDSPAESSVARLIRTAGRRPMPPAEMSREIHASTYAVWREEAGQRWAWARPAIAAAALIAASVLLFNLGTVDDPLVATVDRTTGSVEYSVDNITWRTNTADGFVRATYIRTGDDSRASLHLASDVDLRLDHGTTLLLRSPSAIELLVGRIYVDSGSAPGQDAAIEVITPHGEARDIGTRFEVSVDERSMEIRVRDGTVLLAQGDARYEGRSGETVKLDVAGSVERSQTQAFDETWAWAQEIAPPFEIEDRRLIAFLRWVAHETGTELRFQSAFSETAAEQTVLHGSIEGFTPREALSAILATTDLEQISSGPGVILIALK